MQLVQGTQPLLLEDATNLNATAVAFLQQGNNKEAAALLIEAMSGLAVHQLTSAAHPLILGGHGGGVDKTSTFPTCRGSIQSVSASSEPSVGSLNNKPDVLSSSVVYNRAFLVGESCSEDLKEAVILYNAGLACHREGLESSDSNSLAWGLHCYQMAFSLINVQTLPSGDAVVLVSALCNNIAQIHSEWFNIQEAREWRKILGEVMDWTSSAIIGSDDFAFFHRSLFYSSSADFSFAPAA